MEITYIGHSCFKIAGKDITVVCDPFNPEMVGLPFPKIEANVVTVSHDHRDHNAKELIRGDFVCFDSPGEYEIKNAEISGIPSLHDEKNGTERGGNTIFELEIDGIRLCHLGDLGTELSSEQIDKIDSVDVLMVPVGGTYTIDAKMAAKVISDLEPKIVLPMHYRAGKMAELAPLSDFVKEIGKEPKKIEKLKLTKKDLPEELTIYTFG